LLRALSGDWQSFTQPPSQRELRYSWGNMSAVDYWSIDSRLEVTVIDDPQRVLRIWVVVSGDYGDHLQPLIERTINKLLPPGTWARTV
jgi:hypothetical protein